MKRLTIKSGDLFLDGEKIENLKFYKISSSTEKMGVAELEIVIDVSISSDLTELRQ